MLILNDQWELQAKDSYNHCKTCYKIWSLGSSTHRCCTTGGVLPRQTNHFLLETRDQKSFLGWQITRKYKGARQKWGYNGG